MVLTLHQHDSQPFHLREHWHAGGKRAGLSVGARVQRTLKSPASWRFLTSRAAAHSLLFQAQGEMRPRGALRGQDDHLHTARGQPSYMPTIAGCRLGCIGRAPSAPRGACASAPAITVPAIILIPEAHFDCGGSIGRHCVEGDAPLPGELRPASSLAGAGAARLFCVRATVACPAVDS